MRKDEKTLYAIRASSKEGFPKERVNQWYDQLSWHGMKRSMSKTEVMWISRGAMGMEFNGAQLNQTDQFKYLGSWVLEDGKLESEKRSQLGSAGKMWNDISGAVKAHLYRQ